MNFYNDIELINTPNQQNSYNFIQDGYIKQRSQKTGDSPIHFAKTMLSRNISREDRNELNQIAHANDTAGRYFNPENNIYQGNIDMTQKAEHSCLRTINKYDLNINDIRKGSFE